MTREPDIEIRPLAFEDSEEFLQSVVRSASLHLPWITPPRNPSDFEAYVVGSNQECLRFGLWAGDGQLAGVVNINAIIRGAFQNGSLGFYVFEGHEGRGLMLAGLRKVVALAFQEQGLHRLEANIQLGNVRSRRLVERLGFRSEGIARRLLKVSGEWRDHERFALTVEEWDGVRGGNRRETLSEPVAKLSVSVPGALAQAERRHVGGRQLSGFVAQALAHELEREQLGSFLGELDDRRWLVPL